MGSESSLSRGQPNDRLSIGFTALRWLPLLLVMLATLAQAADFTYTTNNGSITITGYTGPLSDVAIPDMIDGLAVAGIGTSAFLERTHLTSIRIPNTVTSVGAGAFDGCENLTNLIIPSGVSSLGSLALSGCTSLSGVTIPSSLRFIEEGAFGGCTSLTSITVPDNITTIAPHAFAGCSSLRSVTLGTGVSRMGDFAFAGCPQLSGVYFRGDPPTLELFVFAGDTNAVLYYLTGATGWGPTLGDPPTMAWNPQVPTSDARFGVRANQFGFPITGTSNLVLVVEACADLAHPSWSPVATNILTGGSSYFSDPQWTNYPARFYRLRSP